MVLRRRDVLASLFWLIIFPQGYLLVADSFLTAAQPSQAFALAFFIGVDVALASLLLGGGEVTPRVAVLWAGFQLALLLGNPLTGPQVGMSPEGFARYLFGLWAYDAITAARAAQVMFGLLLLAGEGGGLLLRLSRKGRTPTPSLTSGG